MLKPVEKPIKFIKNLSTKGKSYPITHVSAVIDDNGESIKSTIDSLKNKSSMTEITWLELKNKRDAGKLIPGTLYRITDYKCTTTQENTRSAGHQFDIVLLALSEDKLAEEGWAMEHPTDVYDVTFTDGVTKKCYFYVTLIQDGTSYGNVVDVETLLGIESEGLFGVNANFVVNEEEKTATTDYYDSTALTAENLTYNYFQNSNLSAWKVWYCLDNDKSRFAWADDSVDEDMPAKINNYWARSLENDKDGKFAWYRDGLLVVDYKTLYTDKEIPEVGDTTYSQGKGSLEEYDTVSSYTPAHEGTGLPNGRGVIYRLIDEWNIDYPCDFKNMQTLVPMDSNDNIAMENPVTSKYCYVFTDNTSGEPEDLSIKGHAVNIKVKANLIESAYSAMYFSPTTLFYTNRNESNSCEFSRITVGITGVTIFINRGNAINILDGSSSVILKSCQAIYIGYNSKNIKLDTVVGSTFGSYCENIQLADEIGLNYGNSGVELATKDDLN